MPMCLFEHTHGHFELLNVSDYVDYVYINLEKPDNKWYYFVGDAGEQIILENFSEKVTIIGVIGKIIVGALKYSAVLKHADEVGGVTKAVSKNFDDVAKAVKHSEIFKDDTLKHIFLGNKTGGFHYEGLSDATSKVVQITKAPNANGVYEAIVEIGGKKFKPSTFFPKTWSPEKIVEAIEDVYFNPTSVDTMKNAYEGVVDGVKIQIFLDNNGKIVSAFPKIK